MTIDVLAAFEHEPPVLDFIWPGFLAGTVGARVAPGATGKSFWALEAAMSIACSVAGGDLVGLAPTHTGRVAYLAGEDLPPALVRRIHAIGQTLFPRAPALINEISGNDGISDPFCTPGWWDRADVLLPRSAALVLQRDGRVFRRDQTRVRAVGAHLDCSQTPVILRRNPASGRVLLGHAMMPSPTASGVPTDLGGGCSNQQLGICQA